MDDKQAIVAEWTEEILCQAPLLLRKIQANTRLKKVDAAKTGLNETLRFLYLCSRSDSSLTPSQLIDELWHEFILFTRTYHAFCKDKFGQFVHHQPDDQRASVINQYQKTLQQYEVHFGQADNRYWPVPESDIAQCGPCEN